MHAPAYLQNMTKGKYAQRMEPQCPLSCPEKRRSYDMRQLQGYKPSPIAYKVLTGVLCERLRLKH